MKVDLFGHQGASELYNVPALCSKIIHAMQTDGEAYLHIAESRNWEHNGLYKLLDELCDYWGWDKKGITIESGSIYEYEHPEYKLVLNDRYFELIDRSFNLSDKVDLAKWNKEKYYGMFIGRADPLRIRALHKHANFHYKKYGLTSFNDDLHKYMCYPDLVEYFMSSNQTYNEMLSIPTPYSDIDNIRKLPITPPINTSAKVWNDVYKKIGIEIICETNITDRGYDVSEKILRAIYYKKPYLIIGAPNVLTHMYTTRGFKSLPVIPNDYDNLHGPTRVDRVFEILEYLIDTGLLFTLEETCAEVLDYNYNILIEDIKKAKANDNF